MTTINWKDEVVSSVVDTLKKQTGHTQEEL
jgi:hypothetical protein